MTVGMAFSYFEKENVDIAVVEVGLGGRLDSTNIITPECLSSPILVWTTPNFWEKLLKKLLMKKRESSRKISQ